MDLLAPAAVKKLARELGDLQEKPPEGIRVIINEQNLADVQVGTCWCWECCPRASFFRTLASP